MRFPLHLPKLHVSIPNLFRRNREQAPASPEPVPSTFRVLRQNQGADAPEGWVAPREPRALRIANPDGDASGHVPARADSQSSAVPGIEVQSPTTVASPLSQGRPSLDRQSTDSSTSSFGDYNPQWVYHRGQQPLTDATPHGSLHVVNGSPTPSSSSSTPPSPEPASHESSRSQSPDQSRHDWLDGFNPIAFPPPGGYRPLGRNGAMRLSPGEAGQARQNAIGRTLERPGAPAPDHERNINATRPPRQERLEE